MPDFYRQVEAAILEKDVATKCEMTGQLQQSWEQGCRDDDIGTTILPIDDPGRPAKPELVDPR